MTGIIADESAPAATSWNRKSGIRNAAKNASSCAAFGHGGGDRDVADVAEDARDQERARDDQPGACEGERGPPDPAVAAAARASGQRHLGRLDHVDERRRVVAHVAAGPRVGQSGRPPAAVPATRGCTPASSRGSRGPAAPGRRAGPHRPRAGGSRSCGAACAGSRPPAARRGVAAGRGGRAGRGRPSGAPRWLRKTAVVGLIERRPARRERPAGPRRGTPRAPRGPAGPAARCAPCGPCPAPAPRPAAGRGCRGRRRRAR